MVEIKMEVPDQLAQRLKPAHPWLATLLEISLAGFRTPAGLTAAEVVNFLASGPSPAEVRTLRVSERAQARLRELLTKNSAGTLSEDEEAELGEVEQLEHILIALKTHAFELLGAASRG